MTTKTTTETTAIEPVVAEVIQARPAFLTITKPEEAALTGEYLTQIRAVRARIKAFFKPDIDKAHALHKSLIAKMKTVDDAPAKVEMACRGMLGNWQEREELRQAEEQKKLDDAARAKALKAARESKDKETHQAVLNREIPVVSTQAAAPVQKVAGFSSREYWTAEVDHFMSLVKAAASGACPLTYLQANTSALNATVRAARGQIRIPGVRAVKRTGTVAR